jgi:adenylosuccinate lyase
MAESVMIELTKLGMDRQDAHERVRVACMIALEEKRQVAEVFSEDETVAAHLTYDEIVTLLNPDNYIGTAVAQVEALAKKLGPLVA